MEPKEEPTSLNSQSEVAVLVADSANPIEVTPTTNNNPGNGPQNYSLPTPPPGGSDSRQISSGKFPSSSRFSVKRFVVKKFPIIKWFPNYKFREDVVPDAVAGLTVGLTAVPQSIAYANVAGLSPEYGLYSSFVSCFVYLLLGSCRSMTIGPTALVELLVYEKCGEDFSSCVILVGFWVGVIQFLMGLLKLGAIVALISDPVTIGFVAGSSLTISSSQIKSFLGLGGEKGKDFIGYIKQAVLNIKTAKVGDSCLGLACVVLLLICKNLKDYVKPSTTTLTGRILGKVIWFLVIGRNALVVILASIIAASLTNPPFALTGTVKSGLPPVGPPDFVLPASRFPQYNETTNGTLTFWETWGELKTAPLMIAIVSILQNVAIAKAFGSGQSIDATQEMIALGVSHICASFFSAMPTAGSFTRSALNEQSGVRSPIGGIVTGVLVIFALSFLSQWFFYIPKATLAAVILCAVLPMIEYESLLPMWRCGPKTDVLTVIVTFLASLLLGMEYGIIIGVGLSLVFYMIRFIRPHITWYIIEKGPFSADTASTTPTLDNEKMEQDGIPRKRMSLSDCIDVDVDDASSSHGMITENKLYLLIVPEQGGFMFPSVDAIRSLINKLALSNPEINLIVLNCQNMIKMDYTSASALCSLVKALKKTNKSLVFLNCKEEWAGMMQAVGLKEPLCYNSIDDISF